MTENKARTTSAAMFWCQTEVHEGYKPVVWKFTSATDQNIQLCETKIPSSKLVRAQKQKKTPAATVQSYEAGPTHAIWPRKINQFLKYCIKSCWTTLHLTTIASKKRNCGSELSDTSRCAFTHQATKLLRFLTRLILMATTALHFYWTWNWSTHKPQFWKCLCKDLKCVYVSLVSDTS